MLKKLRTSFDMLPPKDPMTIKEWDDWFTERKEKRPVAFFLLTTIPDGIEHVGDSVVSMINNTRSWIRYRVFDRMHVIQTGLDPGYHCVDTRMMHGMFNLLIDYVELELAWRSEVFGESEIESPWWSRGLTRFKSHRNPKKGLESIKLQMAMDDPSTTAGLVSDEHAGSAREVWILYHWWKVVRPSRPDPDDISGWTEFCKNKDLDDLIGANSVNDEQAKEIIDRLHEIEQAYEEEDTEMLMRLIKIRGFLWT